MNRISLSKFVYLAEQAEMKYPNAKLVSVGHGCSDSTWYYALFLNVNGTEIRYEIPMYEEEN